MIGRFGFGGWVTAVVLLGMDLQSVAGLNQEEASTTDGKWNAAIEKVLKENAEVLETMTLEWSNCRIRAPWLNAIPEWRQAVNDIDPGVWRESFYRFAYSRGRYLVQKEYWKSPFDFSNPSEWLDPELHLGEIAFDGKRCYLATERHSDERVPNLLTVKSLARMKDRYPQMVNREIDYFQYAGLMLPNFYRQHGPMLPQSMVCYLLEAGGKVIKEELRKVGSSQIQVVEIEWRDRRHHFELDKQRGWATRGYQQRDRSGNLLVSAAMSDFRQIDSSGLWLPFEGKVETYASPLFSNLFTDRPIFTDRLQVTSVDCSPLPDQTFSLAHYLHAGLHVTDGELVYVVSGGRKEIDPVVDQFRGELHSADWPTTLSRWSLPIVLAVNVFLLLIVGVRQLVGRQWQTSRWRQVGER